MQGALSATTSSSSRPLHHHALSHHRRACLSPARASSRTPSFEDAPPPPSAANARRAPRQRRQRRSSSSSPPPIAIMGDDDPAAAPTAKRRRTLRIAVQGCCHGELDRIYSSLELLAQRHLPPRGGEGDAADNASNPTPSQKRPPVDLLIIAGDFQAFRNLDDVETMACPPKYRRLGGFWRYYSGAATAPVPTVFIGGNHEASNYLQELPFGGWVAPNIYYLGDAGCVRFGGLRIAGLSGIWAPHDYPLARWERPPYTPSSLRSVYHARRTDVHRLLRLAGGKGVDRARSAGGEEDGGGGAAGAGGAAGGAAATTAPSSSSAPSPSFVDVFISHDWPQHITRHGDSAALFRRKPYFRDEAMRGELGSPALQRLLETLRPKMWFAAHMHVKFPALVRHGDSNSGAGGGAAGGGGGGGGAGSGSGSGSGNGNAAAVTTTRFLCLDKCLPGRDFLQLFEVDDPRSDAEALAAGGTAAPPRLEYDDEWLAVLRGSWRLGEKTTATGVRQQPLHAPPGGWDNPNPPGPDAQDLEAVRRALDARYGPRPSPRFVPDNFVLTAPAHPAGCSGGPGRGMMPRALLRNPQTTALLELIGLPADCLDPPPQEELVAMQQQQQGWGGAAGGGGGVGGGSGPPPAPRPMPVPAVLNAPWLPPPTTAEAAAAAARNNPEAIDIDDDEEDDEGGAAPAPQKLPPPPSAWLPPTADAAAAAARNNPEEIDIGNDDEDDA